MLGFVTLTQKLTPEQIYKLNENDKKRRYSSRVLEVERGTFKPLVFTTTGGMSNECQRYHSRLAELLAVKKQEIELRFHYRMD